MRDVPGWHLNAVPCWGRQEPTWASGWSVGPGLGALDTTAPEAAENSAGVRKSCTAGVPEPRPGTRQGLWGSANALLRSVLGTKGERARGTGQHAARVLMAHPASGSGPICPQHRHCITPTPQNGGASSHSTTPQSPADLGSSPVGPADRTDDETDPERRQPCSRPTVTSPVPKPQCQGSVPACITHRS